MQIRLSRKWTQLFRYLFFFIPILFISVFIWTISKNKTKKIFFYLDINECSTNNGGCDTQAVCTNTPGNFSCTCKLGFFGDGFSCSGTSLYFLNYWFYFFIYFILFIFFIYFFYFFILYSFIFSFFYSFFLFFLFYLFFYSIYFFYSFIYLFIYLFFHFFLFFFFKKNPF